MPAYKDSRQGTWYASFYFENWQGVKQKKLKRGFATKKDALAWEREFLLQQAADLTMTFEAFVEIYATNYYITIREMKDGKIVPSEKTDRMNDEARKLCNNRSNLEVGDVLFSGTGTIGETAVIEKEPCNWNIKEGVYAIKPNQTMIQPMYLRYILMTDKRFGCCG